MAKPAQLRSRAAEDIEGAVAHYVDDGDEDVAGRFIDAVEKAVSQLVRQPHLGSLRFAHELGIPELRSWPVRRFPYVIFYVEQQGRLDVWRVLHTRRDIPATLADETPG